MPLSHLEKETAFIPIFTLPVRFTSIRQKVLEDLYGESKQSSYFYQLQQQSLGMGLVVGGG